MLRCGLILGDDRASPAFNRLDAVGAVAVTAGQNDGDEL
jgi:hypothetical protein